MDFLKKEDTTLVVVDMQEKLMSAMPDTESGVAVKNVKILLEAAKVLDIPVHVTEQYPKGLGPTIGEIKESAGEGFHPVEKLVFSCARSPEFMDALKDHGRSSVILCGVETHVCVLQTAIDLVNDGYRVYVPADAVVSRKEIDWKMAIDLMDKAGAVIGTTEAFLFQLLERAGTDEFKQISKLVR
ncbi:MAG TPA: hydrolase [Thermodesulfobacteriota bacterium]|nr:hydrolase [Thermodesulfobacteriota bacterium]